MSKLRRNDGRWKTQEIQQPAPVFFSPEEKDRMTVGYQRKVENPPAMSLDEVCEAHNRIMVTIAELRQTKERLKSVLDAREAELAYTRTQLRKCVKDLCEMCGDDQNLENGTCKICQWWAIREGNE